jgi:hypothetical protein
MDDGGYGARSARRDRENQGFQGASLAAGPIPVAVQGQALLRRGHVVREQVAGWAAVGVLLGDVRTVLLAEAAVGWMPIVDI